LEFEEQLAHTTDNSARERAVIPVETGTTALRTAGQPAATRSNPIHATNPIERPASSRQMILPALITLLVAAVVIGGYFLFFKANELTTTPLVASPVQSDPLANVGTAPTRTLAYSLSVQSFSDGRYKDPFVLSGEMLFRNRDRIRLNIKTSQTGVLYILNQGPDTGNGLKQFNILFPTPTTNNASASLTAGQEIQIPKQSWFELDNKEGTEQVLLVWSYLSIPELESAKRFANPEDRGRIKDAELNAAIDALLRKYPAKANVERDDDKKESRISGNTDIVTHTIKLEHH